MAAVTSVEIASAGLYLDNLGVIRFPCRLLYRHPVTHNRFYFRDFQEMPDGALRPVGYQRYRERLSTIFETELDAEPVVDYLVLLGYRVTLVSVCIGGENK